MSFEENKANIRLYLVFILVLSIIRILIISENTAIKEPLNGFTLLHFMVGLTTAIIFNNPLVALILIVGFELWEIIFCFRFTICFPSEVGADTLNDIIYGYLGYLIGLMIFKPKQSDTDFKNQLIEGIVITFTTLLLLWISSELLFILINGNLERFFEWIDRIGL